MLPPVASTARYLRGDGHASDVAVQFLYFVIQRLRCPAHERGVDVEPVAFRVALLRAGEFPDRRETVYLATADGLQFGIPRA